MGASLTPRKETSTGLEMNVQLGVCRWREGWHHSACSVSSPCLFSLVTGQGDAGSVCPSAPVTAVGDELLRGMELVYTNVPITDNIVMTLVLSQATTQDEIANQGFKIKLLKVVNTVWAPLNR